MLPTRPPWTTSRVVGSPEPPLPFTTERAFPNLKFDRCIDLAAAPGTNRLFVAEQDGKIYSFPNRADAPSADLAIDLREAVPGAQQVYAIAFHPQFKSNRYCYVCYIKKPGQPDGTHVARFVVRQTNPPIIDPSTETTILTWLSGGHNGCCLRFGPDGYLYISTGDGVGPNPPDSKRTGQDISDLLSSILRIDVDRIDGRNNYRIPADNPFRKVAGARPEIWAYGLRNPWRMSFDRKTGTLWVGDVGWELWEMVYRVKPGGNYGWSIMEGPQAIHPEWKRGPTPILPPAIAHPHTESSSITDGLTYYGSRLKPLVGMHLYGDYDTGRVWGFRDHDGRITEHRELADTTHRIVAFGEDLSGEFYLLDHTAGTLHRLIPNTRRNVVGQFPRRLSDTGLFTSVINLKPAPGVVRYSIQAEPWEDYAIADRMIALPGKRKVYTNSSAWRFPTNTVLAKTLSLEETTGEPSSLRRIETQLLHYDGVDWRAYTYRWNAEQTDADLVDADGDEIWLDVTDRAAPQKRRRQRWRFAGRAECQRCHNKWSGPPLGFNARQLNRMASYADDAVDQLDALVQLGVLSKKTPAAHRPWMADPSDREDGLQSRARAYLHANCSHCHRLHAGGSGLAQMPLDVPLDKANLLDAEPTQGRFGIPQARVIAPGDPYRSVLWYRMAKLGGGRMPHIGSSEVDQRGLALIYDWISSLEPPPSRTERDARYRRLLSDIIAEKSGKRCSEIIDELLASTPGALFAMKAIDDGLLPEPQRTAVIRRGVQGSPAIRDLFERFVPSEQRVQRLGATARPEQILAIAGDANRGRRVFFETAGVQCKNCHRMNGTGGEIGPDLSKIGARQSRAQLLESILEPSKRIAPEYVTYSIETADGRIHTGLLSSRTEDTVTLKDSQGKLIRIPQQDVVRMAPSAQSLMPDVPVRDLTAQQVADLLSFLSSCK